MRAAASSTGKRAPVSLFTIIMLTRAVRPVTAWATASGSICPLWSGWMRVTFQPWSSRCFTAAPTEECSAVVVTISSARRFLASAAPKMARLLASLPPEVK